MAQLLAELRHPNVGLLAARPPAGGFSISKVVVDRRDELLPQVCVNIDVEVVAVRSWSEILLSVGQYALAALDEDHLRITDGLRDFSRLLVREEGDVPPLLFARVDCGLKTAASIRALAG